MKKNIKIATLIAGLGVSAGAGSLLVKKIKSHLEKKATNEDKRNKLLEAIGDATGNVYTVSKDGQESAFGMVDEEVSEFMKQLDLIDKNEKVYSI